MLFTVNNTISIKRLVEDVDGKKSYPTTLYSNIQCYIEPLSDDVSLGLDGIGAYEGHKLFTTHNDLIIGDKVIDKDGVEYKVKGLKDYNSIVGSHIEAIIQSKYD